MKKSLIIIVAVIVIILAVVTYFSCKKKSTQNPQGGGQNQISTASGTITNLGLDDKTFFPVLNESKNSLYFLGDLGTKMKKFFFENQKTETIFDNEILFIVNVYWAPDKSKVIIKNNDPNASSSVQLYDLASKTQKDLSSNIENLIWSSDSKKIYYHYLDDENGTNQLNVSNPDGSDWQKIIDLEYETYGLIWLNNFQDIGYWTVPTDEGGTKLKSLNVASKTTKEIISKYTLGDAKASPDGSYFAYEKFNEKDGVYTIAYAKSDGSGDTDTGYQSSVEKIGWLNNQFLIVSLRDNNNDSLYKIDVTNGQKVKIENNGSQLNLNLDVKNIMPKDERTFYFTSSDILYKISW